MTLLRALTAAHAGMIALEKGQDAVTNTPDMRLVPTNEQIQAVMLEATKEVRSTIAHADEVAALDKDIARMEAGPIDMGETGWAIMRAIWRRLAASPSPSVEAVAWVSRVMEVREEGDGVWRPCSGCQESVDGCVSSTDYPYSAAFGCHPGGGCSECGGLGVIWDTTDYAAMARDMLAAEAEDAHPAPDASAVREGCVSVPRDLILFLLGEGSFEGRDFADEPPVKAGYKQPYWWRSTLRQSLSSEPVGREELREKVERQVRKASARLISVQQATDAIIDALFQNTQHPRPKAGSHDQAARVIASSEGLK